MSARNTESILEALRHFDQLPDVACVRQPVVEALFGISSATVWRRVHSGDLPQPQKYGPRTTTWQVGRLRAVLSAKLAA